MNHHAQGIELPVTKEIDVSEDTFRVILEKVRSASDLISRLKEEKHLLASQLDEREKELLSIRSELSMREQEVKRLRMEYTQLLNANGKHNLSEEEKENLKRKIRDLIAKINSYL